jgi:hypothetical protein
MLHAALRTALAATLFLAACGEDSEDDPGASIFAGSMTGANTATLAGDAVFGVTLDDAAKAAGFSIVLGGGRAPARIALFAYTTPRPRVGTYEIVAPNFPAGSDTVFQGSLTYVVGGTIEAYEIRGGSIDLTMANHNRATGTVEFRAIRTSPDDGAEIVINGSFDAAQIPQVFPQ